MLGDERAPTVLCWEVVAGVHRKAERRHVRAQRIVRRNRLGHEIGTLRLDAWIEMLSVVAVGPTVERAVLHRRQIVRHKIGADLIPLVGYGPELAGLRLP